MAASRLILLLVFSCGSARANASDEEPAPAAKQLSEMHVTVSGQVLMPDGSPASGATVKSADGPERSRVVARTDDTGRFQLRGMFGNGASLHASSADGNYQTTQKIASVALRDTSTTLVELTLAPAVEHDVSVIAEGRPVEGARVAASGTDFTTHGMTGPEGNVRMLLPASDALTAMVAWHPDLGVRGVREFAGRTAPNTTQLELHAPGPLEIRVVDPDGKPVSGLELGVALGSDGREWAQTHEIDAALVRTDAEGTARLPWAPREGLTGVDAKFRGFDWKADAIDLERLNDRIVTIHARRLVPVEGRLVLPKGAKAEGLLISGFGFGPGEIGDIPYARARADGTFTIRVSADHGYVLAVTDLQWSSDVWSGAILSHASSQPVVIAIPVQRVTPLTIRVTRGEEHIPVRNAWVEVGTQASVEWVDSTGKKQSGRAGINSWLKTDSNGEGRAGVGRGKHGVRLSSDAWEEEQAVVVSSDRPVTLEFHRDWPGKRHVAGRLTSSGRAFEPSPRLVARAWAPRPRGLPPEMIDTRLAPDGTFHVEFDAEYLSLLFSDPEKRMSGFAQVGWREPSVDLKMEPIASYSGTLRNEKSRPMPGQTLGVFVENGGREPIVTQETDPAGRFRFDALPVKVPLVLSVWQGRNVPEYYIVDPNRDFTPGEARENEELRAQLLNAPTPVARPSLPLGERLANTCRNVRPAGMRALVILKGDDSQEVASLVGQLLDDDRAAAVLSYLPLIIDPDDAKAGAATLGRYGWPAPAPGELVLVALNGDQETIATKRIGVDPPAAALANADGFLEQHRPAPRDALATLTTARAEAQRTDRRVWVVYGGPRCGPCFRLGRWMDDHHETLEKDFVIVKVIDGIDTHADLVFKELPYVERDGIPWHAITTPDGTVLVTSHGPAGNIGFPGPGPGLRHFRNMLDRAVRRLTADEVEGLIKSLLEEP